MKKRMISIALSVIGVIGVSVLLAFAALQLVQKKNVTETGNVLGISWYDEAGSEFVLTTAEELKEFADLSEHYDFQNQTVKLGADIVLNEGNVADWKGNAPANRWKPINNFMGTFDGQGHTISGLYAKSFEGEMAMFINSGYRCTVKDFSLKNSYFTTTGFSGTASIMSNGGGNFYRIYSDAIIDHKGENVAGIASQVTAQASFEECWFDGSIRTTLRGCGGLIDAVLSPRVELKHCLFSGEIHSEYDFAGTKTGAMIGYVQRECAVLVDDCLSCGVFKPASSTYSGGFIGVSYGNSQTTVSNSYVSDATYRTVTGTAGGSIKGSALSIEASKLVAEKAYQWTMLDFDNYWTAVDGSTPVLKQFVSEGIDLTGVKKAFDISWYQAGQYSFEINTPEQLYGWYYLSGQDTFEDKTIKLGADIVLNEGNAADWEKNPPANKWVSIPSFAGTFDGQGHTLSGIYSVSNKIYQGLIDEGTAACVIRNLNVKNSFYYNSNAGNIASVGSVIGETRGTLENIYSNAIVISEGSQVGGIVGRTNDNDSDGKEDHVTIRGCWFDGSVSLRGEETMEAGGILGRAVQGDLVMEHCLNTGTISAEIKKNVPGLGGLIGVSWASGLTMTDCFSDGKLNYVYTSGNGAAIGRMPSKYTVANITNTYATQEACVDGAIGGGISGVLNGGVVQLPAIWLTGQNAAKYSSLDFENYWVLQKNGTPRLGYYTQSELSAKGIAKAFDTSWYNKDAKEVTIKTPSQLLGFTMVAMTDDFANRTVKLGADITMDLEEDWISIGSRSKIFAGTFDGQGYTISGLTQKASSDRMGLFGSIQNTAVLKNFRLENSTFEYYNEAANEKEIYTGIGSVCSDMRGDMENIYSNATVISNASRAAGIAGAPNGSKLNGVETTSTIKNCWFDGEVRLVGRYARYAGGIAGVAIQGNIEILHCLNTGKVSNERPDGGEFLGGMISNDGNNYIHVLIKDCLNTGTITGVHWNSIGAIIGAVSKSTCTFTIEDTYALDTSCVNHKGVTVLANRNGGTLNNGSVALTEKKLTGLEAYFWTSLDFENHWAVMENGMPELKAFSTGIEIPSDAKRMVDTSWYDASKETYIMEDAADLYGLARLVNGGNSFSGKTVKLGADITINTGNASDWEKNAPQYNWRPIANSNTTPFKGTFDGDMHTISGIYVNTTSQYNGLFGCTQDATIKNLKLTNNYIASSGQWTGSLVGRGGGTFSNLYSDAIVECGAAFEGGFIGQTDYGKATMDNCWFDGTVINTYSAGQNSRGFVGGFIGYATQTTVLKNCLYTGSIDISKLKVKQAAGTGGFIGVSASDVELRDSAMLGTVKGSQIDGYYAYMGAPGTAFAGSNAYAVLEAPSTEYSSWQGNYGGKASPNFSHTPVSRANVLGGVAKTTMKNLDWSETWQTVVGNYPVLKLFAGDYVVFEDTSWYDASKDSYVLNDSGDLYGFAQLVNSGNSFAGKTVKLGADIVVNTGDANDWATSTPKFNWVPIGASIATPFKGTFDGDMHTISGLYMDVTTQYCGLFGSTNGATVKNLKFTNSYIASGNQWVGSIVGRGNGTFQNIYSNATVKSTKAFIGGLFGQIESVNSTMTNCWFDGTVISTSAGNSAGFVGGIVGYAATTITLDNCLNTGHIDITATNNTNAGTGGLVGVKANTVTIKNSAMLGTIKADGKNGFYAILGENRGGSLSGSNIYIMVERNTTAHTNWQGAYPGAAVSGFSPTRVTWGNVLGDAAKTTMPQLDWTNTWKTVEGSTPILKVFAE